MVIFRAETIAKREMIVPLARRQMFAAFCRAKWMCVDCRCIKMTQCETTERDTFERKDKSDASTNNSEQHSHFELTVARLLSVGPSLSPYFMYFYDFIFMLTCRLKNDQLGESCGSATLHLNSIVPCDMRANLPVKCLFWRTHVCPPPSTFETSFNNFGLLHSKKKRIEAKRSVRGRQQ